MKSLDFYYQAKKAGTTRNPHTSTCYTITYLLLLPSSSNERDAIHPRSLDAVIFCCCRYSTGTHLKLFHSSLWSTRLGCHSAPCVGDPFIKVRIWYAFPLFRVFRNDLWTYSSPPTAEMRSGILVTETEIPEGCSWYGAVWTTWKTSWIFKWLESSNLTALFPITLFTKKCPNRFIDNLSDFWGFDSAFLKSSSLILCLLLTLY